KFCPEGKCV
uniref:Sperm-activating peptide n=1 Tax=Stomopneutes variolaris TaxID=7663 RepID=SAP_STOVA|nr:RecName: Full=Sperm-activating peptide; Short=SAP [Stomopneustes variolaris]pir/S19329/ sperm-activating peptide SAP - sea urchin (Stomopneustes variolus) [Stomopneustes variolus]AAB20700.1 peptide SV-1=sperm-activating peptide [Stomopneustes variolaris=sea urchins, egg jelly, Peptide, 9 aa] [Stomopneustes variolaris]